MFCYVSSMSSITTKSNPDFQFAKKKFSEKLLMFFRRDHQLLDFYSMPRVGNQSKGEKRGNKELSRGIRNETKLRLICDLLKTSVHNFV